MEKFNQDTGHAILMAARLDVLLQQLLLHAMPLMSNGLAKDLFEKGPLGTFSAKIGLVRAMGLLDEAAYRDLCAIKAVRNLFAHAENPVRFASPEVIDKVRKFSQWREGADARMLFNAAVERSEAAIDEKVHRLLHEHATTP